MSLKFEKDINVWPVFTDVMMGAMFIFLLIVLSTAGSIKQKRIKDEIEIRKREYSNLPGLESYTVDSVFWVDTSPERNDIRLVFNSAVLFNTKEHELRKGDSTAQNVINDIGKALREFRNLHPEKSFHEIIIEGHTDSDPFREHRLGFGNWGLSSDRANTVLNVLQNHIDSRYLSPRGYADQRSMIVKGVSPSDSLYKEKQRRIEIMIRFEPDSIRRELRLE